MKKLLALLLILVTVFACTACGIIKSNNLSQQDFTLGTLEKQSYKNEFLGMGCLLPGNWVYLEQDRMDKLVVEDGEICAMYATASEREVLRLDFRPMDQELLKDLDLTQFCRDYLSKQSPFLSSESDPAYDSYTTPSISVSGQSLTGLVRTVTWHGNTVIFAAFAIKCNGYVARISIATAYANRIETIMSWFYTL